MPEVPEVKQIAVGTLDPAQATKLSVLVDLEARWENLRKTPQTSERKATKDHLEGIQRAYEAYRDKLAAYNKLYAPAHVPELLLNTPARLSKWCKTMRSLYMQVEHDPRAHCPAHLLEKAYRSADRISVRMNRERIGRSTVPESIRGVIMGLEAVCAWCANLDAVGPAQIGA